MEWVKKKLEALRGKRVRVQVKRESLTNRRFYQKQLDAMSRWQQIPVAFD